MSANFSLSVPMHGNEAFIRDAQFIITPGLEVNIYYRGYFAVKGMYSTIAEPQYQGAVSTSGATLIRNGGGFTNNSTPNWEAEPPEGTKYVITDPAGNEFTYTSYTKEEMQDWAERIGVSLDVLTAIIVTKSEVGTLPAQQPMVIATLFNRQVQNDKSIWDIAMGGSGSNRTIPQYEAGPNGYVPGYSTAQAPTPSELANYGDLVISELQKRASDGTDNGYNTTHFYHPGSMGSYPPPKWSTDGSLQEKNSYWNFKPSDTVNCYGPAKALNADKVSEYAGKGLTPAGADNLPPPPEELNTGTNPKDIKPLKDPKLGPSLLEKSGLNNKDIEKVLAYPYYQVFHGIIIQVGCTQSVGVQTITVQCQSMLHFWQFQKTAMQGAVIANKPPNSGNDIQFAGPKTTGWTPYSIVYYLVHNTVGDAAGVSAAIQQKTNIDASVLQAQMYSLIQKYWEKRFSTRIAKLRMHGVTGKLYNSIQAEVLGRVNSKNKTGALRAKFKPAGQGSDSNIDGFSLFAEDDFKYGTISKKDVKGGELTANVLDMIAYAWDPGKLGQLSLFESTYETKMDVIQNVLKVTGFEFYQDVDGDFVFKPPMYNLDTKSSRVYRIEDIDIINLTFDEKEPSVTYMRGKGETIAGIQLGLENEYKPGGDFFDYKLISQFGWREGSFETTAVSDPLGVQHMAISQMAILNAGMNAGSVTIPLRPEIRPGYPVYISCIDTYYYVTSVSHSFSMGGQCSTTLQLVAKRAKFFAPGDPTKEGIEAIDLSNPTLPKKPLTTLDGGGKIHMVGFPNVVMALDPDNLSPVETLRGVALNKLDDPEVLQRFISAAVTSKILRVNEDGTYVMSDSDTTDIVFSFQDPPKKSNINNVINLTAAAKNYAANQASISAKQAEYQKQISKLQTEINNLAKGKVGLTDSPTDQEAKNNINTQIATRKAEQQKLTQQIASVENDFNQTLTGATKINIAALDKVLKIMTEKYGLTTGISWDYIDKASTTTLLNLLSNKKASFSGVDISGDYRYYSCSHPEPLQQGQKLLTFDNNGMTYTADAELKNPANVKMFLKNPVKRTDGLLPEASLGVGKPKNGVTIATGKKDEPYAVVPTSEFRQFGYAVTRSSFKVPVTNTTQASNVQFVDLPLINAIKQSAIETASRRNSAASSATLNEVMGDWFAGVQASLKAASEAAIKASDSIITNPVQALEVPTVIVTDGGYSVNTDLPISSYNYMGNTGKKGDAFVYSEQKSLSSVWTTLSKFYGASVANNLVQNKNAWALDLQETTEPADFQKTMAAFNQSIAAFFNITVQPVTQLQQATTSNQEKLGFTPVIPVSDANGYEVYGLYRYGRDITIEPDGVFDVLANQDPVSLLDKSLITQLIDSYIEGKPLMVKTNVTGADGKPMKDARGNLVTKSETLRSTDAATTNEKEVVANLNGKLSDTQLLDLGLAVKTGDPNMIQMNLANWIADKGKDGVQKLPINNAAYSLASLKPADQQGKVCSCRLAEASVLLDSVSQAEFIKYASPGTAIPQALVANDTDQPTKQLIANSMRLTANWQASQAALRGKVLDTQGSNLVSVIQSVAASYEQQADQLANKADQLTNEIENAWNIATDQVKK
jgi:hypothetical protein